MMANDNLTKPREAAGKALAQGGAKLRAHAVKNGSARSFNWKRKHFQPEAQAFLSARASVFQAASRGFVIV